MQEHCVRHNVPFWRAGVWGRAWRAPCTPRNNLKTKAEHCDIKYPEYPKEQALPTKRNI